jgi:hypothetical protein
LLSAPGKLQAQIANKQNIITTTAANNFIVANSATAGDVKNITPAVARTNLGLAAVATSGAYGDLSGTPTIPATPTLPILGLGYGTCSTAAGTSTKVGVLAGFVLAIGAQVRILFTNANTATTPTLNVNATGAAQIWYNGAIVTVGMIPAGYLVEFMYDGTYWQLTGIPTLAGQGLGYGTCSTAATTAAKVGVLTGFALLVGARVDITFAYANTATTPTLNVNATGAKIIRCDGIPLLPYTIPLVASFVYDGTYWQLLNPAKFIDIPMGYTTTAATTAAKAVVAYNYDLEKGSFIIVNFTVANTAAAPYLNINGGGARTIQYNGAALDDPSVLTVGYFLFKYDGTYFQLQSLLPSTSVPDGVSYENGIVSIKYATVTDFVLTIGAMVILKFMNTNATIAPSLNVTSTGAYPIRYNSLALTDPNMICSDKRHLFIFDGTYWQLINPAPIKPAPFCICDTAETTASKVVMTTCFTRVIGAKISVLFTLGNTATTPTLNVNATGAAQIWYNGAIVTAVMIPAGYLVEFMYDGTYWQLLNPAPYSGTTDMTAGITPLATGVVYYCYE